MRPMLFFSRAFLALSFASAATAQVIHVNVTVAQLPTAQGDMRIINYRPETPLANLLILYGGNGKFSFIPPDGGIPSDIFLQFVNRGSSVYLVDVPASMQAQGWSIAYRNTPQHLAELTTALQYAHSRDHLPAWILGWSAGTVSATNLAISTPRSTPFGIILESPATAVAGGVLDMNLEALQRPTLLLTHVNDMCPGTPPANAPVIMSRISATPARRHVQFTGGITFAADACSGDGPHGLGGLDIPFADEVASWQRLNASFAQPLNYQGLWWRSPAGSESGWGVNLTHQGDILFATWFTYDADGSGMWLVMSNGNKTGDQTYSGALYRTTGPAFSSSAWSSSPTIGVTEVGSATFTFIDSRDGTMAYVVNGVSQSKAITRQAFADPVPACLAGASHLASPNYQALGWASSTPSESGWGVNIAHQGDILFATWFTYDANGTGMWLVMSNGNKTGERTYSGSLYRTTGAAFNSPAWGSSSPPTIGVTEVGSATFTFTGPDSGTFAYVVNGISQSKAITRQLYANPVTVCR